MQFKTINTLISLHMVVVKELRVLPGSGDEEVEESFFFSFLFFLFVICPCSDSVAKSALDQKS